MKGTGPVFRVKLRRGNLNSKGTLQRRHDNDNFRGDERHGARPTATVTTAVFSVRQQDTERMVVPNPKIVQMIKDVERKKKEERASQAEETMITYYLQNDPSHAVDLSMLVRPGGGNTAEVRRTPLDVCKGRRLNAFMAFRIYYSQFGNGLRQDELSSILSKAWRSFKKEQILWKRFTEEFGE